jgi:uncharacterized protein YhdP
MHGTRAEPGVAPGAAGAAGASAGVPLTGGLQALILAVGCAAVIIAAALLAYALALARVPQHRAALEELIQSQTGLEVRFSELGVRWGWYGPEAVFRGVELAEPGAAGVLLRAPTLLVDFDTWRMLRGGALAAGRITLENPTIDLADGPHFVRPAASGVAAPATRPEAEPQEAALAAGARVLSNWRGARVDIEGGTLRLPAAVRQGSTLELAIREVSLRRTGARVTADATVFLPQNLGAAAHARLDLVANPKVAGIPSATLELEAERLDFGGWRATLEPLLPQGVLPLAGSGNLVLHVRFDHGRVLSAGGTLAAEGLAWQALGSHEAGLRLDRLRGAWQLTSAARGWHLTANRLELDVRTPAGHVALAGLSASIEGEGGRLGAAVSARGARLTLSRPPAIAVPAVQVGAHLAFEQGAQGWRLSTDDLRVAAGALVLHLAGAVSDAHGAAHPHIDARASLTGADLVLLQHILGAAPLAALGVAPGELAAGRIDNAQIELRGPLDEPLPWKSTGSRFSGSLELHAVSLLDPQLWSSVRDLDAQVTWQGGQVRARLSGAEAGTFRLESGAIEWNRRMVHVSGRVAGAAQEALAWLLGHPELRQYAPRLESLDMRGNTLVDFDIRMPALAARAPDSHAVHSRFVAMLDGVRLRPVEGLPPISTLRGTLAVNDGHLQRSTLTGTWLGGPVVLTVSERRTGAAGALAVSGHGLLNVGQALLAAGGDTAGLGAVSGTAEWNADFRQLPGAAGGASRWRARLDSSLVGLASRLPEPLAKTAAAALPLDVELTGTDAGGELHLSLGERLHAVATLAREGEFWQVARGALSLGASEPAQPSAPVVLLSGRVSRVDLPACVALWRGLAHNPGWPALHARLTAAELSVSGSVYSEVTLTADSAAGADTLRLDSPELAGDVRWPAGGGPAKLTIEDLKWQGRSLGRLTAALTVHGASTFEAADIHLSGASEEGHGALRCAAAACNLKFSLESGDAAATLASFGLRSDVSAAHARLEGELGWQPAGPQPALATATGRLHIQLEDGATRAGEATTPADTPFALLVVPALIAATGSPELRFASLTGDFTLADGQAVTSDLHFDGDAEILMRGRVGLLARDYDGQLWILKGEGQLPAAVRGFEPAPKIAALWLSLRSLVAGQAASLPRNGLHLRGSWDEPVVTTGGD